MNQAEHGPAARCLLLPPASAAASCGYALAGRGSFLPDYIKTLGMPMFGNHTPVPSRRAGVHAESRLEFQSSRRYTVVPSDEGVDGIVRGEWNRSAWQPVNVNAAQLASRTRVTVIVKVKFEDVKAQKTLWENPACVLRRIRAGQSQHWPGRVGVLNNERVALDRLSTDFAQIRRQRHPRGLLTLRLAFAKPVCQTLAQGKA